MTENPSPATSQKRAIATKLTVVARQLWQRFDRSVERIGVSRPKWRLMAVVAHRPGATQRVIAEVLGVSEVTAGRLIDRLCADGILERQENPNDRRAHCVGLAPAAHPILKRLGELASTEEEEAFAGFTDADLEKFESLLDALARNIEAARTIPARAALPRAAAARRGQSSPDATHEAANIPPV